MSVFENAHVLLKKKIEALETELNKNNPLRKQYETDYKPPEYEKPWTKNQLIRKLKAVCHIPQCRIKHVLNALPEVVEEALKADLKVRVCNVRIEGKLLKPGKAGVRNPYYAFPNHEGRVLKPKCRPVGKLKNTDWQMVANLNQYNYEQAIMNHEELGSDTTKEDQESPSPKEN